MLVDPSFLERLLAPAEQPAMIVKRRLEQAGYEIVDKLDELGAADLGFLMKFVFKSVRLGGTEVSE
jgi:adenylate cyclase